MTTAVTVLRQMPVQVQPLFFTGFECKSQSNPNQQFVVTTTGKPSTSGSWANCDKIHGQLQEYYESDGEFFHYECQQWHTWVYKCRAKGTCGPDCIAVIKV